MRYGLEVRVPFLSKRIYNYAIQKDRKKFINLLYGKLPLRRLVSSLVNKNIAYKKKQGFRVPIREWVSKGELGKQIEEELLNNLIIDKSVISNKKLNLYFGNKLKYYRELFALYLLNNWLKKIRG
jgi:asparagine synthase (glutamine-hydrolysing)